VIIDAAAPTRIDLAGGTLDIAPLYLLLEGGCTINLAITRYARVRLEPARGIVLVSEDTGDRAEAEQPRDLDVTGPLGLVARAVRFVAPPGGVQVTTRVEVPVGSGLGASSALLVALLSALLRWRGEDWEAKRLLQVAANLEAQVIRIPTGWQDFYAAYYGGLNLLTYGIDGVAREALKVPGGPAKVAEHLALCYTGASHHSAVSNWAMLKGFIEGGETVGHLTRIRDTAVKMRKQLEIGDWVHFNVLMGEEWENRKRLAPGVSTPEIDRVIEGAATVPAENGKVCGAGGGGCVVIPIDPKQRKAVEQAISYAGATVLPFEASAQGVTVTVTEP